jgi:hypothetical protein
MMRRLSLAILTSVLLVAACNSVKKPSNANFTKAINQYLQVHGQACTWIGQAFPVDISDLLLKPNFGIGSKMAVLEQAGLLQSKDTVVTVPEIFGPSIQRRVKRYQPTAAGRQYLQQNRTPLGQSAGFCYATKTVDSIVNWTEPTTIGPTTQTEVTYTYKISSLAPWAKRTDIQNQFGDIRATIAGISKTDELAGLQLTNQGWEVPAR